MRNIPGWLFAVSVLALVGATALCSVVAYGMARQFAVDAAERGIDTAAISFDLSQLSAPTKTPMPAPTSTPLPEPTATPETGVEVTPEEPTATATPDPLAGIPELQDPTRKTILLLGIDQRTAVDTETAFRSDTIMLINVDPVRKRVGLLSIPRDMYVSIPGYTQNQRINTANYLGDLNDYPGGGGPALAAETIRQTFGIRVDNYVRINFDVFETLVDTLAPNGIEVCPTETINDPTYPDAGYGMIHVHFDPGCQRLNATRLLQYARTRKTQGGDFDRARRQQEVLKAAQAEFLSLGGIANFFVQAPALYNTLIDSISTNMSLEEIIALARLAGEIPRENITSGVIDTNYVTFAKDPTGADVLVPIISDIRVLIQDVFNPQPQRTIAELRTLAEAENANITVYNGTDIAGLASDTRDWLISQQVPRVNPSAGNLPVPDNGLTRIRNYTGKRRTAQYLAALLGIPEERIETGTDGITSADILVIAGSDIRPLLDGQAATPTP